MAFFTSPDSLPVAPGMYVFMAPDSLRTKQLQFEVVQHGRKTEYDADMRLLQERFPKIHSHPRREHAGLSLQAER